MKNYEKNISYISILSNIVCIEKLYRIYGAGIHKIRFNLKQEHNIEIP